MLIERRDIPTILSVKGLAVADCHRVCDYIFRSVGTHVDPCRQQSSINSGFIPQIGKQMFFYCKGNVSETVVLTSQMFWFMYNANRCPGSMVSDKTSGKTRRFPQCNLGWIFN